MSYNDARIAIENEFIANWDAAVDGPFFFQNVKIDTPETPFVRIRILGGDARRAEINGGPQHFNRYIGDVQIDVLVKENVGPTVGALLADKAAAVYRGKEISYNNSGRIIFGIPSIKPAGVVGGWDRIVVRAPFQRDVYE